MVLILLRCQNKAKSSDVQPQCAAGRATEKTHSRSTSSGGNSSASCSWLSISRATKVEQLPDTSMTLGCASGKVPLSAWWSMTETTLSSAFHCVRVCFSQCTQMVQMTTSTSTLTVERSVLWSTKARASTF